MSLLGPLSEGNALAEHNSRFQLICPTLEQAKLFHSKWHVNSNTLRYRFHITKEQARDIVRTCGNCATLLPQPSLGVNPKGLQANHLWQMDVTHVPEFGQQKYIHISVDTYSGIIMATPLTGENSKQVITHWLGWFSDWGIPKQIKTDNGPAYTSKCIHQFLSQFGIVHTTGIPYNPQGQGIMERANGTFKRCLQKIRKGGIGDDYKSPRDLTSLTLYILNFLSLDHNGTSAADRHAAVTEHTLAQAKWKDILTGQWRGPDPVLRWHRGSVCLFP
uniref:RNA-directed DNA polymerase n=1 Tax=Neovison vison TaxID=452646 RepID=A0A8C7ESM9_NEOVI